MKGKWCLNVSLTGDIGPVGMKGAKGEGEMGLPGPPGPAGMKTNIFLHDNNPLRCILFFIFFVFCKHVQK